MQCQCQVFRLCFGKEMNICKFYEGHFFPSELGNGIATSIFGLALIALWKITLHLFIYIYIYTCPCTLHTYMYICIWICINICRYAYMHVHIHMHIHVHRWCQCSINTNTMPYWYNAVIVPLFIGNLHLNNIHGQIRNIYIYIAMEMIV